MSTTKQQIEVKTVSKKTVKKPTEKVSRSKKVSVVDEVVVPFPPKRVKKTKIRAPKGTAKPQNKLYFNDDTQDAIVEYQNERYNFKVRDKIYIAKILPAFEKLVENLINIHRFSGIHDSYDDLKHDCISFLFETLCKFDATRGTKAFSYFNVVAKNWLIVKNKLRVIKNKKTISIESSDALTTNEEKLIDEYCTLQVQDDTIEKINTFQTTIDILNKIRKYVVTENELICINSIITIFEDIDNLDLLTKSAIMFYVKELTGLSSKQLTSSLQTIRKTYAIIKESVDEDDEDDNIILSELNLL